MLAPYKGSDSFIFISYAHKDKERVYDILFGMGERGYRFWYDEGIDPGTEWDENIAEHVVGCDGIIAFISENYLKSENCKDELNYARDLGKDRLLVYLEEVNLPAGMAMRMNRLQAIHYYTYDERAFFEKLKETPLCKRNITPRYPQEPVIITQANPNLNMPPKGDLSSKSFFHSFFLEDESEQTECIYESSHGSDDRIPDVQSYDFMGTKYVFDKVELIANGFVGTVFKAHDCLSDRYYALKKYGVSSAYLLPFFTNPDVRWAILKMKHDSICTLRGFKVDASPTMVMDYIDGVTLSEYLKRNDLKLSEAILLLIQVLEGLEVFHKNELYYGDLNPDNIMVAGGQAYLCDYSEVNFNGSRNTNKTVILKEFDFCSPERGGSGVITLSSDFFEAGRILAYMLVMIRPENVDLSGQQLLQLTKEINKRTMREPADRGGSIREMIDGLHSALKA